MWQAGTTLHLCCVGFSLWWLLMLSSTGSRCSGFSSFDNQALELRLSSYGAWLSCPKTYGIKVKIAQPCLTLCNPMDYTAHGILQIRILGCIAFPFSSGSSQSRDHTHVSCIAGEFFTSWPPGKPWILNHWTVKEA